MQGEPLRNEVAKDNKDAGEGKGDHRERNEEEGATTSLPEGPAVDREAVGATDAFHDSCQNAGCPSEADDKGEAEAVSGPGGSRRSVEVALEQGADVRGQDAIEEDGKLKAEGKGIGQEADNSCRDDEGWEERNYGGVGGGLGKVEPVMPHCP